MWISVRYFGADHFLSLSALSHSSNHLGPGASARPGMLQNSAASAVPLTVEINFLRLLQLAAVFSAIIGGCMYALHGDGIQVEEYYTNTDSYEQEDTLRDYWNGISGYVMTAVLTPLGWFLGTVLPVGFLSFAPSQHMKTKQTIYSVLLFTCLSVGAKSLVNMGFNAAFAKIKQKSMEAYVFPSDLAVNTDDLDIMLNKTTTMDNIISEYTQGNYITNTVLRNVFAPIVLQGELTCKGARERNDDNEEDTSQFATGLVQSYGFPLRTWQSNMLPINYGDYEDAVALNGSDAQSAAVDLPMGVETAAKVFIHAMHMSEYFFRWSSDYPFNVAQLIQNSTEPDSSDDDGNTPVHSVAAAEFLGLLPSDNDTTEEAKTEWFLEVAGGIFKTSLSNASNVSASESTMEFSHVDISDTITYDSVTFEVPLRKNFFYRKLIYDEDSESLQEDTAATATYSSVDYAGNTSDIYYDLDITADCGPNPGLCVMPHIEEYGYDGNEYHPDPQIRATAVCLNSNGTEDFEIDYEYYVDAATSTTVSESTVNVYWACPNRSSTSMWIVSLGSRITGDKMYDGRAPDSTKTDLDSNRATLVNPRKVYTLTVGLLSWELVDLAEENGATCTADSCQGLEYFLDQTSDGSFDFSGTTNASLATETDQYIIVGESSVPSTSLQPFKYNETEQVSAYSGYGSATRWVPLMTLVTPTADQYYTPKGHVIFPYNFNKFDWTSGTRSGANCSDAAEDHLNHVVNNHYYVEYGLQPSYTAGMYFLFQNGVVRNVTQLNSTMDTLVFDGNLKVMGVYMTTPRSSMVFTIFGISILLLGAIVVLVSSRWLKRALHTKTHEVTAEMVADMMLNDKKYPGMMLQRRIESPIFFNGEQLPLDQFRIERIVLRHQEKDISVMLPLSTEQLTVDDLNSTGKPSSSDTFYVLEKGERTPSDGTFFVQA